MKRITKNGRDYMQFEEGELENMCEFNKFMEIVCLVGIILVVFILLLLAWR